MRILHVLTLVDDAQSYGGPVSVAVTQIKAIAELGVKAKIIAGWRGVEANPPKSLEGVPAVLIPVHAVVPNFRFSGLHSWTLLRSIIREVRRADVVHIHLARDLVPISAALISIATGTPCVTQSHGMIQPDPRLPARVIDKFLIRPMLTKARFRFSLTSTEDAQLAAVAGQNISTTRLRNAVRVDKEAQRSNFSRTPSSVPEILFLARLHPRKRVADFIEAARLIAESNDPTPRFTIVGPDDGDGNRVRQASLSTELSNHLRYEGSISHERVSARLAQASVYVLPSDHEPFPMSLLEALACGVPSICTTGCGISAELRQSGAALVVEPGQPAQLANAISEILTNSLLSNDLSVKGQAFCATRLGTESLANNLRDYYHDSLRHNITKERPILWLTNVAPSYRVALWKNMSRIHQLNVALLGKSARSASWHQDTRVVTEDLTYIDLNAPSLTWGRAQLFLPTVALVKTLIAHRRSVVLTDGWEAPAYWVARLLQPILGYSLTTYYRGLPSSHRHTDALTEALRRWFFSGCAKVFTGGPDSSCAVQNFGVDESRIAIVPNSVDNQYFERARSRRKVAHGHRYGYVGQFIDRKNIVLLIRAFAKIASPEDTLILFGEGEKRGEIQETIRSLSVKDRVFVAKPQSGESLIDAYASIDTLALVSSEEIWGLVVNEALAAGCSVVASTSCGVAATLQGNPAAVLCEPSVQSVMEALLKVKEIDPAIIRPLREYDVTSVAQELATTLGCLIK